MGFFFFSFLGRQFPRSFLEAFGEEAPPASSLCFTKWIFFFLPSILNYTSALKSVCVGPPPPPPTKQNPNSKSFITLAENHPKHSVAFTLNSYIHEYQWLIGGMSHL